MSYIIHDYKIIQMIESRREVKLTLTQAVLFSIINSYNRKGQRCTISYETLGEQLKCSLRTAVRVVKDLEKMKIISVYRPKNPSRDQANTYYVHK